MGDVNNTKQSFTGDPSGIVQTFPKFDIQLLCCRYWWLKNWEHNNLGFPFWRLYYNFNEGASMKFGDRVYSLNPDTIYLIAPFTNYSTWLYDYPISANKTNLVGGSLTGIDLDRRNELYRERAIAHLFIHFHLNNPNLINRPGIYTFPVSDELREIVQQLRLSLLLEDRAFNISIGYLIYSLICFLLNKLNMETWKQKSVDVRIVRLVEYMRRHLTTDLSNETLAHMVGVTPNALLRIFKSEVGVTLQNFVRKERIKQACSLFLHTDLSIDQVATQTGFANRYHFSRVFHEETKVTPAKYKKASAPAL